MNDARAVTWMSLFPAGASYAVRGGPNWLHEFIGGDVDKDGGLPIFVAWDQRSSTFPNLSDFSSVVAVNCQGLSAGDLIDAGFPHLRRYAVVPNLAAPRWFIPLETPTISSAAFQLYSPLKGTARLKRFGAQAIARAGLPMWYRDQVMIALREISPIEQALQTLVPNDTIRLALSTGTPGPDRKPTAALITSSGRVVGYAKLACSKASGRQIQREADVLRALALRPGHSTLAPRLLWAGEIEDRPVSVQSVLPGRPPSKKLSLAHRRFLTSLGTGAMGLASNAGVIRSLHDRIADLALPRTNLVSSLDFAVTLLNGLAVPATIVHGDFAPWNLRAHDGEVAAFDWESAELDGLPMLDEIQHLLQVGFFLENWSVDDAYDRLLALASAGRPGLRPTQILALQIVSLLVILTRALRRLEDGYDSNRWLIARCQRLLDLLNSSARQAAN